MNILITGGASGLGKAITTKLSVDKNNKVYFTYSKSGLSAKKIEEELKNTISIKCDFAIEEDINLLLVKIKEIDLDVLINNAYNGEYITTYFHKISSDKFLSDFQNNIIPTIKITQAAINGFRVKKCGKIITILSAALVNTPPIGSALYVANKAYLEKLTKVWASENAKFNISSNSISPAFMQTNLTADIDERLIDQMKANHPLKKLLTVEEVAETVAFMLNATTQINGVDLIINAGTSIK